MNNRLLLIDDELEIRELAADFFSDAGYLIDLATCGNEGIAMMEKQDYNVVITDLMMPDGNGEQVVSWVMQNKAYMGVIVMTGYGSVESAVKLECGISEQLTLMKKTIDNLTGTITEMHQLAQSQESMIPMYFQEVNLDDIIDEVIHDIHLLAANRQLEITFNRRGSKDGLISVDADKIRRALFELIQNAVKFTPDGGSITVNIRRQSAMGNEPPKLLIDITDTGIGIAATDHEKVFEKFYKIQDVHTHHSSESAFLGGGLGIGLSLAKNLVETHEGSISLTSDYDNGSTFTISLPCREAHTSR